METSYDVEEVGRHMRMELVRLLAYKNPISAWDEYILAVEGMPDSERLKEQREEVLRLICSRLNGMAEEQSYMQAIEALS